MSAQGAVAIPGTKRRRFLEENAAAHDIELNAEELSSLDQAVRPDNVSGARYTPQQLASTDR